MVFDHIFALVAGYAIEDAYRVKREAIAADYIPPAGFRVYDVVKVNDDASTILPKANDPVSFGYIAQSIVDPTLGLLVLRGTSDFDEWIEDAKFLRRGWKPEGCSTTLGEVMDGFVDMEASIRYRIPEEVKSIAIVGHSLGSALAVLIAMQMTSANGPMTPSAVYLFACPNVGDAEFAHIYNRVLGDITFRIVIPQDIVPHLPPRILGYENVGQNIIIFPDSTVKASLINYHEMTTYLAMLKEQYRER